MRTHNAGIMTPGELTRVIDRGAAFVLILLGWTVLATGGCGKDPAMQAMETDAHGYLCMKCNAKLYTGGRVFLEDCPKCRENALVDVVGFWCEHDKHLTIRPKAAGPQGASVCEKCGASLKNAMVSPREKDLLAWGATQAQRK